MKTLVLFLAFTVHTSVVHATTLPDHSSFFMQTEVGQISESEFHHIMDRITDVYAPLAAIHGARLIREAEWKNDVPQATAKRIGAEWAIIAYGGVARLPSMTPDALMLVMCHEVGHLFGGYVFYPNSDYSTEGEADYFATHVCLRKLWADERTENARSRESVAPLAKAACDQGRTAEKERDLCYRTANAALAVMAALSASNPPRFETPDLTAVEKTIDSGYPSAQCRLDTYLRGAACSVAFREEVIPGRVEREAGSDTLALEKAALALSCRQDRFPGAARPACWFKERH